MTNQMKAQALATVPLCVEEAPTHCGWCVLTVTRWQQSDHANTDPSLTMAHHLDQPRCKKVGEGGRGRWKVITQMKHCDQDTVCIYKPTKAANCINSKSS